MGKPGAPCSIARRAHGWANSVRPLPLALRCDRAEARLLRDLLPLPPLPCRARRSPSRAVAGRQVGRTGATLRSLQPAAEPRRISGNQFLPELPGTVQSGLQTASGLVLRDEVSRLVPGQFVV